MYIVKATIHGLIDSTTYRECPTENKALELCEYLQKEFPTMKLKMFEAKEIEFPTEFLEEIANWEKEKARLQAFMQNKGIEELEYIRFVDEVQSSIKWARE